MDAALAPLTHGDVNYAARVAIANGIAITDGDLEAQAPGIARQLRERFYPLAAQRYARQDHRVFAIGRAARTFERLAEEGPAASTWKQRRDFLAALTTGEPAAPGRPRTTRARPDAAHLSELRSLFADYRFRHPRGVPEGAIPGQPLRLVRPTPGYVARFMGGRPARHA